MVLSATEKYDPYENAVAERIKDILKYEFGFIKTIPSKVHTVIGSRKVSTPVSLGALLDSRRPGQGVDLKKYIGVEWC
jgi:hypothetical protein